MPASFIDWSRKRLNAFHFARWRRSEAIGKGSYLDPTVQVIGMRHVRIGHHSQIGEGSWLNVNHQPPDGTAAIQIGTYCLIGRRNFISPGISIDLGDFLLTGSDCAFVGAEHIFNDPTRAYVSTGATRESRIVVEPNCWFGLRATVIGDITVGRGSIIAAGTMVMTDIPPFSIVAGSPGRVVKRFSFTLGRWIPVSEVTDDQSLVYPDLEIYRATLSRRANSVHLPRLASGWRQGGTF